MYPNNIEKLKRLLDSINSQTYKNFDILVLNNKNNIYSVISNLNKSEKNDEIFEKIDYFDHSGTINRYMYMLSK